MPTGYTDAIKDGIDFKTYAFNCARAFGALAMMRDEPNDAVIPDEFEPSKYNETELIKAKNRFQEVIRFNTKKWQQLQDEEYVNEVKRYEIGKIEEIDLLAKYKDMLIKAKSYIAPSAEHEEYRSFMIKQIEDSIKFDCNFYINGKHEPVKLPLNEYVANTIATLEKNIAYHNKANVEELERTADRNKWVKQLRDSLK